jgi:hypothetical protein
MVNFSKIFGLASTALVFAGMAFGQNPTCSGGAASQTPLVRVEGTTELVGEYTFTCGTVSTIAGTANILDILSLPVTSKVLNTSGTAYTEAIAVVSVGGTPTSVVQGTVTGSQVSFSGVPLPSGISTVTIANIRVNATSLTVGTGTPPAITESAFVSGANVNSSVTGSVSVAYAFTGLSTQTAYKVLPISGSNKGVNNFLVCQAYKTSGGLAAYIDVGENFATAFKGAGTAASNNFLGAEFTNNTETGVVPTTWPNAPSSGVTNVANTSTMLQVVFSNVPSSVTLYVPVSVSADNSPTGAGFLTLVGGPTSLTAIAASTSSSAATGTAALTATSGSATAYYLFTPGSASSSLTETFAIGTYVVMTANTVTASTTPMTAAVSFAPIGSTQFPNFVIGPSTTTTSLSTFTQCTTSLLFPFVTNQLGFDTGLAIANTSSDPFGSNGATAQAGTCTLNFYGAGAPSPSNVVTPSVPSGTVYTSVLSSVAAGFQGYIIAQCNFQYAHGFAFVTDGVGANGGLSQGYLAGVIPDTNQLKRTTANPIGVATSGMGETLGN